MKASYLEPRSSRETVSLSGSFSRSKTMRSFWSRVEDAEDVAWLKHARRKKLKYRPLEDYLAKRNGK
jgi:hypothetical protein